jgi:hypothetical protein
VECGKIFLTITKKFIKILQLLEIFKNARVREKALLTRVIRMDSKITRRERRR